jgi:hypothetical protein
MDSEQDYHHQISAPTVQSRNTVTVVSCKVHALRDIGVIMDLPLLPIRIYCVLSDTTVLPPLNEIILFRRVLTIIY